MADVVSKSRYDDLPLDEMVRQNIQDVIDAANLDAGSASAADTHQPSSSRVKGPKTSARTPASTQRLPAGPSSRTPAVVAAGDTPSSLLDVPQHMEATLRLHKARIKSLEGELKTAVASLDEREKQHAEAMKELRSLRNEKATWSKTLKGLEVQVDKYKKAAQQADEARAALELQLKDISKDGQGVDKARKQAETDMRARDVRLQRALDEVEKYKQLLTDVKAQEREGKDVARSDYNRVLTDNKRLEQQRSELLIAFKKQLKLIDILKKQKLHLEAARALAFTEEEFMKVLDVGGT